MTKLLVAGGAGFIGRVFLRNAVQVLGTAFSEIHVIDKLTYASDFRDIEHLVKTGKVSFANADVADRAQLEDCFGEPDLVVNFAAESHVDNSIRTPELFALSNYVGTSNLLELSTSRGVRRFMQISTDEVYGSITEGEASEDWPLNPSSPYSASKASADLLVLAFAKTYGLQAVVTRTCNNFGPGQHHEKLIPKAIDSLLRSQPIEIYGSGSQIREWIDVRDNVEAILEVLLHPGFTGIVNIGSGNRISNLDLISNLITFSGSGSLQHVEDRPGHDERYAISSRKFEDHFSYRPRRTLEDFFGEINLSRMPSSIKGGY